MSVAPSTPRFEVKGWHVFAGVSAFFAVIIAVDIVFMALALRTFPGQVSVTPYEDGLLYNRHIAQMDAQDRLGWRVSAESQAGSVVLTFQDRAGAPVGDLIVKGRLERPATEAGRMNLRFTEVAPGRYAAPTGNASGTWDLTAEAHGPQGATFQAERRLTWP